MSVRSSIDDGPCASQRDALQRKPIEQVLARLPEAALDQVARRLKVLGHPDRLRLVVAVARGAASVGDLARTVGIEPAATSKHLRELLRAGVLVLVRRSGRSAPGSRRRAQPRDGE